MAKYTYKQENGEYVFYKDEQLLKTPHDVVVKTPKKKFADLLLTTLEHFPDYSSPTSLLTYHYTFCNLNEETTEKTIANNFSKCISYEALMNDDYLMFRQSSPVKQSIAAYYEKHLPEHFHLYNMYQLSAVLVIQTAFHSWMLSHYIISDLLDPLYDGKDWNLESLKEEFLDDLEEYECEEFGCDPEDETYVRHRQEMSETIDAFVYYFILDSWTDEI